MRVLIQLTKKTHLRRYRHKSVAPLMTVPSGAVFPKLDDTSGKT